MSQDDVSHDDVGHKNAREREKITQTFIKSIKENFVTLQIVFSLSQENMILSKTCTMKEAKQILAPKGKFD